MSKRSTAPEIIVVDVGDDVFFPSESSDVPRRQAPRAAARAVESGSAPAGPRAVVREIDQEAFTFAPEARSPAKPSPPIAPKAPRPPAPKPSAPLRTPAPPQLRDKASTSRRPFAAVSLTSAMLVLFLAGGARELSVRRTVAPPVASEAAAPVSLPAEPPAVARLLIAPPAERAAKVDLPAARATLAKPFPTSPTSPRERGRQVPADLPPANLSPSAGAPRVENTPPAARTDVVDVVLAPPSFALPAAPPAVAPGQPVTYSTVKPPLASRPTPGAAAPSSPPAPGSAPPPRLLDMRAIQSVLGEYRSAFNSLDASRVGSFWPSVNVKALSRAFDQLQNQQFDFSECSIDVTDATAMATCQGQASSVPKIGSKTRRVESRRWTFALEKVNEAWVIRRVDSSR